MKFKIHVRGFGTQCKWRCSIREQQFKLVNVLTSPVRYLYWWRYTHLHLLLGKLIAAGITLRLWISRWHSLGAKKIQLAWWSGAWLPRLGQLEVETFFLGKFGGRTLVLAPLHTRFVGRRRVLRTDSRWFSYMAARRNLRTMIKTLNVLHDQRGSSNSRVLCPGKRNGSQNGTIKLIWLEIGLSRKLRSQQYLWFSLDNLLTIPVWY